MVIGEVIAGSRYNVTRANISYCRWTVASGMPISLPYRSSLAKARWRGRAGAPAQTTVGGAATSLNLTKMCRMADYFGGHEPTIRVTGPQ
jgi:hypothetical protein